MKEDTSTASVINGTDVAKVFWNHENWNGRMQEWGSKYRVRWLNKTDDPKFWSWFDVIVSFESTSHVQLIYGTEFPVLLAKVERGLGRWKASPELRRRRARGSAAFVASNCHTWYGKPADGMTVSLGAGEEDKTPPWFTALGGQRWPTKHRDGVVQSLMKAGLSVSAMGACLSNTEVKSIHFCGQEKSLAKFCAIHAHLFYLAFENSIYPDYVSEKLYEALAVGSIPVYIGAWNVGAYLPATQVIIQAKDFGSPSALVQYLKCLNQNSTVREFYLSWRDRIDPDRVGRWRKVSSVEQSPLCRLCRFLRADYNRSLTRGAPPKRPSPSAGGFPQHPVPCSLS